MKNKHVYDSLLEGVQILDDELRYLYINRVAAQHGKSTPEALVGKHLIEVYPAIEGDELHRRLLEVIKTANPQSMENKFIHNDGSIGWFNLNILPYEEGGVVIFSIDITEKKVFVEEHFKKLKVEALQKLAAGVAHDFNNKLSVFELSFKAIQRKHNIDESLLKGISDNIESSKQLVKTLLGFSHPEEESEDKEVEVHSYVGELPKLYKDFLGEDIDLSVTVDRKKASVALTSVQLDQILLNLLVNSKHALKGQRDGKILDFSKNAKIKDMKGEHPTLLPPGDYIHLTITDNGCGMSGEVQKHAFDYYYSTKPESEGTGLGLATVKSIIDKSGGKIQIMSEPDKGTTFDIWLKAISY